jgi:hypothetical protein
MWSGLHRAERRLDWYQGQGAPPAHPWWPSGQFSRGRTQHQFGTEHQDTTLVSVKSTHRDRIIREETEIGLQPNNMDREDGFSLIISHRNISFPPWMRAEGFPRRILPMDFSMPSSRWTLSFAWTLLFQDTHPWLFLRISFFLHPSLIFTLPRDPVIPAGLVHRQTYNLFPNF